MRKDVYSGIILHCMVCQNIIPTNRVAKAVTCSPECAKARRDFIRSRLDHHKCRYCQRPSTPEERARYQQWSRWEQKAVTEEQSAAALQRQVQSLKRKLTERESEIRGRLLEYATSRGHDVLVVNSIMGEESKGNDSTGEETPC
jgi:hypothetical protein